jgi:pimeloyl-ACP methyl ester carboxylesterase
MPLEAAAKLLDHWRERFDWRAHEHHLNRFVQRMVNVDGQDIHLVVEPGSGPDPLPLVLLNGWPSSFVEFDGVIDRLAHPERHGGAVEDAFTVIIPSMPGYGFSPPPARPMSAAQIGVLWATLCSQLQLERFVVFGSDWGSLAARCLAEFELAGLQAVLFTTAGGFIAPDPAGPGPTEEEAQWLQRAIAPNPESAYQAIQGHKPDAMAFGLTDSPLALATWIIEKFRSWSTPVADGGPPFPIDDLLANVMIYWINGPSAPLWLYGFLHESVIPPGTRISVPAGFMLFADDLIPPIPRSALERVYDVRHYAVHPHGGHFPAQDAAALFVAELTEFFREFR